MKLKTSRTFLACTLAAFLALGDAYSDSLSVPIDGLIAYYPFDGNANDASGNANHGTVNGASLTTDAKGMPAQAYYFDGKDDFITIPGLNPSPEKGSIAAWVEVDSFDLGSNQLNLIFGQTDNLQLGLGDSSIGADGKWVFRHRSAGFANPSGPFPNIGRWTHVTGVWDGTTAALFLDGVEVQRVASDTLIASGDGATIGRHPFAAQNYWHGKIDDVVLYDRALNLNEIHNLAKSYPVDFGLQFQLDMDNVVAIFEWNSTPNAPYQLRNGYDLENWSDYHLIYGSQGENRTRHEIGAMGIEGQFFVLERVFIKNLALGKPATANYSYGESTADKAVDGDPDTSWNAGSRGSAGSPNWLKIDLGAVHTIGTIFLWYDYSNGAYNGYDNQYILYGSTDDSTYTEIASGTLVDSPDFEMRSDTIHLPEGARDYRYLRFDSVGGRHWSSLLELEVYPPED